MRRGLVSLTITALALGCAEPRDRERGEVVMSQDQRDKAELLARLDAEITALDKQIRALETQEEGRAARERLSERRELLFGDRNAVQYATEAEWRVVKERAERDLRYGEPGRI
jgi:hypothetical protein